MMMAARKLQGLGLLLLVTICALLAYPVSLHVASTRTELRQVEREIAETRNRIRVVEGEIAVLANLSQLERWNADNFGYVAPVAGQYLSGERALASLDRLRPPTGAGPEAPVVLALNAAATSDGDEADAPVATPAAERVAVAAMRDIARVMPAAGASVP